MPMTIYPNRSFNEAIAIAFEESGLDKQRSYQFINIGPFILSRNGKQIKVVSNKIRVAFNKNGWVISELNVILEANQPPVKLRGEYALLTQIVCIPY